MQAIGRSHLAGQMAIRRFVADKLLPSRIPAQSLTGAYGDCADVANRYRAMTDVDVANRLSPAADARQEIADVVRCTFQTRRILRQRFIEQSLSTGGDAATVDLNPLIAFLSLIHI